jgi:large subunit ribosomal protein L31
MVDRPTGGRTHRTRTQSKPLGGIVKQGIHPNYRPVVFEDHAAEFRFLTRSTVETDATTEWEDGNTYPLVRVEISSASHPFFTGTMKIVDTAGRVERFERRYGRRKKSAPAAEG